MALTQEQINKIREQDGLQPVQAVTGSNAIDRSAELSMAWGETPKKKTISDKIADFTGNVAKEYSQAGKNIVEGVKNGSEQFSQGVQEVQNADTFKGALRGEIKATGGLLRSGLRTVGNVASAAVAPITEAIKPIIEPVVSKLAEKPELQKLINPVVELANKHPESAKDLQNIVDIATLGVGKAVEQPIKEGIKSASSAIGKKVSTKASEMAVSSGEKAIQKSADKATKLVQSTEKTMTKAERQEAIDSGRVKVTKLGKTEYLPSKPEVRAGELLSKKLTTNPVRNVPIIKKEISTRGKEAEKYLDKKPINISAQEQSDMFSGFRKTAEKYLDKTQLKAYDEQMKLFLKQLPGRGGYNTSNFYKGLKEYEKNVASTLARGKEALLDSTGAASAKLRAAKDIRKIVRDAIGERHKEFKGKMFDLVSLYDALDNSIIKAEQTTGNIISRTAKKYPLITGAGTGVVGSKIFNSITGD
jgi:hypothetical protein